MQQNYWMTSTWKNRKKIKSLKRHVNQNHDLNLLLLCSSLSSPSAGVIDIRSKFLNIILLNSTHIPKLSYFLFLTYSSIGRLDSAISSSSVPKTSPNIFDQLSLDKITASFHTASNSTGFNLKRINQLEFDLIFWGRDVNFCVTTIMLIVPLATIFLRLKNNFVNAGLCSFALMSATTSSSTNKMCLWVLYIYSRVVNVSLKSLWVESAKSTISLTRLFIRNYSSFLLFLLSNSFWSRFFNLPIPLLINLASTKRDIYGVELRENLLVTIYWAIPGVV